MEGPVHEILDNLFLGGENALLIDVSYDLIINCTKNNPVPTYWTVDGSGKAAEVSGRFAGTGGERECQNYIRLPISDDPDQADVLYRLLKTHHVLETIHEARMQNQRVLVHCFAGMQRSCAVVACYIIQYSGRMPSSIIHPPEKVIQFIKSKRPIAFFGAVNFQATIQRFYLERLMEA
jgi:Dual specificity phosphatase, catalytic domain